MNKKNSDQPKWPKTVEIILIAATVIVIFITIAVMFAFADSYRYYMVSPVRETTLKYSLEEGEYGRVLEYVKESEPYDNAPKEVKAYYGIANYFHSSVMRSLAETMGDEKLAAYWDSQKESYAEQAAAFENDKAAIDKMIAEY